MATLSLTTEWAKACYADQLANYPPDNLATQLIIILDELISSQTSPTASACTTATLVEAQHDISLALANLIGFFFSAAESNTSLDALNLLVAYLVELTKQPDAINSSSETKIWDAGGGEIYEIPPGAPIIGEAKRLWRELPMFSWNVTEMFQGSSSNPASHIYMYIYHLQSANSRFRSSSLTAGIQTHRT
jgi:hypothetical protein